MVFDPMNRVVMVGSGFFDIPALNVYKVKAVWDYVLAALVGITPSAPQQANSI